jgi:transcriptional antiterminator RfaH
MRTDLPAWYCVRTQPKHEHIAAANVQKNLGLNAFLPRLRMEKATRRGVVRTLEPLFPCYLFVHCIIGEKMTEIRHTNGVRHVVSFGDRAPTIPDAVIHDLQACFANDALVTVRDQLMPGDKVAVAEGAFAGMPAAVLRHMPEKNRVQVLLNILGRPTTVEVERSAIALTSNMLAMLPPALVAPPQEVPRLFR